MEAEPTNGIQPREKTRSGLEVEEIVWTEIQHQSKEASPARRQQSVSSKAVSASIVLSYPST